MKKSVRIARVEVERPPQGFFPAVIVACGAEGQAEKAMSFGGTGFNRENVPAKRGCQGVISPIGSRPRFGQLYRPRGTRKARRGGRR